VKKLNKTSLLLGTLLTSAMLYVPTATAQVELGDGVDDEIVVTGSRIQRSQDFVANAPVATVEAVQFEKVGAVNTEELLNSLPQTIPGLDRSSNNPGNGTATVDLRGLGAARTLVLVNGRRTQPTGPSGIVDINTISPALIESVEVLTGGASSVYGADAVSGVVNFILKNDFEGVEANLGYQMTDQGDAGLLSANVTLGAGFDDGRGNANVTLGYTNRDELFQGDRDFAAVSLFDDGNGGLEPGGSSGVPGAAIFGGGISSTGGVTFEPDGSIREFVTSGQVNDFYNYAPPNYIQLPQERFTIGANASYEINDMFKPFVEARFSSNLVESQLAPTPIFQTSEFTLDGNPFLTTEAQQLLSQGFGNGVDTNGNGIDDTATAFLRRRLVEVGPRFNSDNRDTFQVLLGVEGDLSDQFSYDLSFSEGRTNNSSFQTGNVNRGRYDQALLLNADGTACSSPNANGGLVGCSPLNIFGAGNISQEAADFIRTAASTTEQTIQRVLQTNIIGDFGDLSLTDSPIGVAIGAEYIENEYAFRPSQDVAASTIAGFNGSPPLEGEIDQYSLYGELQVPLLEDLPFAEFVDLDLAGRVSDYSSSGTEYNYKVGGTWGVNDLLRFRGNYNTAVRAPNIGELFSAQGENFPGGEDPCSDAFRTNPANSGVDFAQLAARCTATGVPAGALFTAGLDAVSGQIRALAGGNPNLAVEEAETITFGAVISPDLFDGFTMSVDYFNIDIENAIGTVGVNTILSGCYLGDQGGAGSQFCNLVQRRPGGSILSVSQQSTNIAELGKEGIDFALQANTNTDFLMDGFLGDLSVNYLGTYTLSTDSRANPAADLVDCTGRFGDFCGEPRPEYSHYTTLGLSKGMLSTQLVWQYIGAVEEGADINGENDPALQGSSVDKIGDRSYFDGSVTADLSDNFAITAGVRNIFDDLPPIIGSNDEQANTFPATYDVYGRTFFANIKTTF